MFLLTGRGFTEFDAPNAGTGVYQGTYGWNINPKGDVAGAYVNSGSVFQGTQVWHSYAACRWTARLANTMRQGRVQGPGKAPHLVSMTVSVPQALSLVPSSTRRTSFTALFGSKHGDITEFDAPGATYGTAASGVNPGGQVVGTYADGNGLNHGFVRTGDGRITTIQTRRVVNKGPTPIASPKTGLSLGTMSTPMV